MSEYTNRLNENFDSDLPLWNEEDDKAFETQTPENIPDKVQSIIR